MCSTQNFTPWAIYRHTISPAQAKNLDCQGKRVLITGGNGGIGREMVKAVAKKGAAKITILARNTKTGEATVKELQALNKDGDYSFIKLDLGDQEATSATAKQLGEECDYDVMVLNAGVLFDTLKRTKDGHEMQFGINHLGHHTFMLTYLNQKQSKSQYPKRVVITASVGHVACPKGIRFNDPNFHETPYDRDFAYGQSKLANVLFTKSLAEKMPDSIVNCLHPGWVATELFTRDAKMELFNKVLRSPKNGSQTLLLLGFSKDKAPSEQTGKYFENCVISENNLTKIAKSKKQRDALWEKSVELTGVDLNVITE